MNINPEFFDTDLPCNFEPLGYIENIKTIETKNAGTVSLIAYGALNYLGRYAPEFGGVAFVCEDPDCLIAVKYIPWSANERNEELIKQYRLIRANQNNMSPSDFTNHFYLDYNYRLPAQREQMKEEYFAKIAAEDKEQAQKRLKHNIKKQKILKSATKGIRFAGLSFELTDDSKALEEHKESTEANTVKNEPEDPEEYEEFTDTRSETKEMPKMIDGEELISFDDETEE